MSLDKIKIIKKYTRKDRLEKALALFNEIHGTIFECAGYSASLQYDEALGYLDSVVNEEEL